VLILFKIWTSKVWYSVRLGCRKCSFPALAELWPQGTMDVIFLSYVDVFSQNQSNQNANQLKTILYTWYFNTSGILYDLVLSWGMLKSEVHQLFSSATYDPLFSQSAWRPIAYITIKRTHNEAVGTSKLFISIPNGCGKWNEQLILTLLI